MLARVVACPPSQLMNCIQLAGIKQTVLGAAFWHTVPHPGSAQLPGLLLSADAQ